MGYIGQTITTVFPTSISVDSATISGNTTVGGTLGVTGVSTLSDNIVFDASSKGVHLGVTSATASNLLDDYEEGTFTPAISMTDSAGSLAYAAQNGYYTKVGDLVHIQLYVQVSNVSGIAGQIRIGGLPFTPANVTNGYIAGSIWLNSTVSGQPFDGDYMITTYLAPNDPTIRMYSLDGDGTVNQLTAGHIGSSTDFMLQYNYKV